MEINMKNNKDKTKFLFKLSFCFALLLIVFLVLPQYSNKSFATEQEASKEYCYLSDMNWKSGSGYKSILKDTTSAGSKISVKIEGTYYTFDKGIWAHAASTVIYDLTTTPNGEKYDYFTAYLGLNQTAASTSNGVIFKIYTSTDGTNWSIKYNEASKVCKPGENATFVKIDISEAKFLKLEAGHNGSNGNDHSVYADAKLIKKTYIEPGEDLVQSIDELDERIKTEFKNADLGANKEYEVTLLKRELISRAGKYALGKFLSESKENREVYEWLTNDVETLRLYLVGGLPEGGSYLNSLSVLSKLYAAHKEDLSDETVIEVNRGVRQETTTLGKLYRKMMLSISLTHSGKVYLWITGSNVSNPVKRYEIYKKLYNENLIDTETFQSLTVEEMRWVMNTVIDDEEIEWLNDFIRTRNKVSTDPYMYVKYRSGYKYWQEKYWNVEKYPEEHEIWDTKYNLSKFNIPRKQGNPKLWIVFIEGAVCGGISKTGCCIWGSYKGLPNTCVSQPAHCAYLAYSQNADGYGIWSLGNDVSGWAQTGRTEHLNTRMPNDWGKGSYTGGYNASYILLAQAAQNEYKKYENAEEILMLANVYSNDKGKLAEIYGNAIVAEEINFDAWLGKINIYKSDETKTDEDYYKLAEDIANTLTYYPRPMYDLLKLIEPNIKSPAYYAQFNMLRTQTLTTASKATNSTRLQGNAAKQVANSLLGSYDKNIANFSFDGVNGGAIVLGSKFDASEARWEYSLDGGANWTETSDKVHKLTNKELGSITSTNDIKIHIIGVARSDKNIYTIDIQESAGLPTNLYANDLENRIVGIDLSTEWRYTENDAWTSYSTASPDLTGDKTVQIRQGATGTRLASSASEFFKFTQDNDNDGKRKYITVSHLGVNSYSTQSVDSKRPFYAPNAIDGNMNTLWHTDFKYDIRQQEANPFITVELDAPKYISALEFAQIKYPGKPNDPDFVKNVVVYVSEDGENWTEAGKIENCTNYNELREVTFAESVYGKYVKLEMGKDDMFSSIAMINLFEDTTKIDNTNPTASVYYSPEEPTNQYVIARLVNPNKEITITNNNGKDTYVFTENGNFTFEFEDAEGHKGTAYAEVNWIKKDAPTADVEYKLSRDKELSILLNNISEDVYLLDKDNNKINYIEVEKQGEITKAKSVTYLDSLGNAYKVAELDENGVIKSITYKNTTGEVSNVAEYVTIIEDGKVASEEYYDSEDNSVTVTDEEKQTLEKLQQTISNPLECYLEQGGDYEFRLLDKASNIAYKSIKADYINDNTKILVSDISYDITRQTNESVTATINTYVIDNEGKKEEIDTVIINEDEDDEISVGEKTHTFEENGEFTFRYADKGSTDVKGHTAKVNWIDKTAPTAEVKYSTEETTDEAVVASLVNESEEIIITNNGTSKEYTFTENGEFTFKFIDKAGNEGTLVAKVDWIEKEPEDPDKPDNPNKPENPDDPQKPENPEDPNKPENPEIKDKITSEKYKIEEDFISRIVPNTTVNSFKQNVKANKDIVITNKDGKVLKEDEIIETGAKIKVGETEYTAIVIGDIDGNGKITIKDLSNMKLHLINKQLLTGIYLKAADINGDGKVSIIDLSQLKLILIGKLEIK